MAGILNRSDLRRIAGLDTGGGLVVSLHLDVDGLKYPRLQDYQKELRGLIHQAEHDWLNGDRGLSRQQKQELRDDLSRIQTFINGEWKRTGQKGLAVFSCQKAGLWEVFELPVSVESSIIIANEPSTKTISALLYEYKKFCVVTVDRKKARFFSVYMNEIEEHKGLLVDEWVPDQVKEGEWAGLRQSRIARHIEDHVMRHLKEIAGLTYDFFIGRGFDRLILAGPKELIPRFRAGLHPYLRERVAGEFNLEPDAPISEVLERSLPVEEEFKQREEVALLDKLAEENRQGGLGVVGLEKTIEALVRGQADTLLIGDGLRQTGYLCRRDHYLSTEAGGCPMCGEAMASSEDIIEEMVQLAIDRNVRIEQISHVEDFKKKNKYGALLRFAI